MANRQRASARETHKLRLERWTHIESNYRRRHREFVMDRLPSMSETHWQAYTKWVADFGFLLGDGKKFNHALKGYRRKQIAEMINIAILAKELL